MNSGSGGRGPDNFEDPFADGDYDPTLAFARTAWVQAQEHVGTAAGYYFLAVEEARAGGITNARSRAAKKSASRRLRSLIDRLVEVDAAYERARAVSLGSPTATEAYDATIDAFGRLRGSYERLIVEVPKILTPGRDPGALTRPPLPPLRTVNAASNETLRRLQRWTAQERAISPRLRKSLLILKTTPGTGKTEAQIREILQAQNMGQRIVMATRTKEPITGEKPELLERIIRRSPTGKVGLAVLVGRDEDNCYRSEACAAASAAGYSPGQAVCVRCEHYPDNAAVFGLPICGYYEERIRAHNMARAARRGMSRTHPLILTTHATLAAVYGSAGGGRYGAHWAADAIHIDEDPTDALRTEISLSKEQCDFQSLGDPDTYWIEVFAELLRLAMAKGAQERSIAKGRNFLALAGGSDEVHAGHGSCYRGERLHELVKLAFHEIRLRYPVGSLAQLLRDVISSDGFEVDAGSLCGVTSVADINRMRIPPKHLYEIARALQIELGHAERVERQLYRLTTDEPIPGSTPDEMKRAIAERSLTGTELRLPYILRMDCAPASLPEGRKRDEWSMVLRQQQEIHTKAAIIVGDAYAVPEHYRRLFGVDPHVVDVVSQLHDEASIVRVLDSGCGVGQLRRGGLQRVLGIIASSLIDARGDVAGVPEHLLPRMRVLLYGHKRFRADVEAFMRDLAQRLRIPEEDWAFEHWWGGRGKDRYNGWEYTICFSDPVINVGAIEHVANAELFWQALREQDPEQKTRMERVEVGSLTHGIVRALSSADRLIRLEHERQNISELKQATHRPRPARNPSSIMVIGEMEFGRDLVAQTDTIVPSGYRSAITSMSQRAPGRGGSSKRRATITQIRVHRYSTAFEIYNAIRAIIDWFGVFSPWFSHSLMTIPLSSASAHPHFRTPDIGSIIKDRGTEVRRDPPVPADGATGRVITSEFSPSTIERVWRPPADWAELSVRENRPKSVNQAIARIKDEYPSLKLSRQAAWQTGRTGRRPTVYWDSDLCDGDAERAERYYFDIVDHQYGPVSTKELDGQRVRSLTLDDPRPLPPSLRAWREDPEF